MFASESCGGWRGGTAECSHLAPSSPKRKRSTGTQHAFQPRAAGNNGREPGVSGQSVRPRGQYQNLLKMNGEEDVCRYSCAPIRQSKSRRRGLDDLAHILVAIISGTLKRGDGNRPQTTKVYRKKRCRCRMQRKHALKYACDVIWRLRPGPEW